MSDILSQNEIDELLRALNQGDIDVDQMSPDEDAERKKAKLHDFRRPSKFAKDHLKTLNIINESYARLINNFLSGFLRAAVSIEVLSVEPLSFYEFNNSISNPAILGIVNFKPLTGSIILELSPNIAFAIIDRILGGRGGAVEKIRGFTEVELVLIERIMIELIDLMREPWGNIVALEPELEKIETNVQFAQLISPNEIIGLITFNARVGDAEGMINLCIPHMVVEPIVTKLSTKYWFAMAEKQVNNDSREYMDKKIQSTMLEIKAVLGETTISVRDCLNLRPGDVLPLNTTMNQDISLHLGDLMKFLGKPGIARQRMAVQITDIIREED